MKKKIFAGIAAFATALTMCFAFTACNKDGGGADDSVKSEEQWVQAFADTLSATNFKFIQRVVSTGKISNGEAESVDYSRTNINEVGFDGEGFKAYSKYGVKVKSGNDEPTETSGIRYFEVVDKTYVQYSYDEDDGWYADPEEYDTSEVAKERFNEYVSGGLLGSLVSSQYKGTGDSEEISGNLTELYSLFSYDSKTHAYSATLKPVSEYYEFEMNLKIYFKGGKLYKLVNGYSQGDGDNAITNSVENTITYGGVSISIPKEVKDTFENEEAYVF